MDNGSNKPLLRRVLVAVDRSKQSEWATQVAGELAATVGAQVALVHAYRVEPGYSPELAPPIEDVLAELKEAGTEILRHHRTLLPPGTEVEEMLVEGESSRQIVNVADRWHADVIVMGTHGRGRLAQFLVGSTAESVIRMARCPVMSISHEPRKAGDHRECQCAGAEAKEAAKAAAT